LSAKREAAASDPLEALRAGGKRTLAQALAAIEAAPLDAATLALLDAAYAAPRAHVVGLTGPPGVGKSTLLARLIRAYREQARTTGVIAVDPSSKRSGGALLGDRMRLEHDPEDRGIYVRSMAARERLGGLAPSTYIGVVLMRALFDVVLVETVGVGQSETDVAAVCDTVVLCIQPGSGDAIQFMKAGIAEIPDVAVVNKADLGTIADRAKHDLESALALGRGTDGDWRVPVIALSAGEGRGVAELLAHLDGHAAQLRAGDLAARRARQAEVWLEEAIRDGFGRFGLARARRQEPAAQTSPFARLAEIAGTLRRSLAGPDLDP
jgi:LAO/AO transport system kinase